MALKTLHPEKIAHGEQVSESSFLNCIERFHSHDQQPCKFMEQKKVFRQKKSSTPTGLVWYTNMAAVSLFWNINVATVASCENTVLVWWGVGVMQCWIVSYHFFLRKRYSASYYKRQVKRDQNAKGLKSSVCYWSNAHGNLEQVFIIHLVWFSFKKPSRGILIYFGHE